MKSYRGRHTKLIATLGPASGDLEMIERLFRAGVDGFRINMSHTDPDGLRVLMESVRAVEAGIDRPIPVMVDLQGPKVRIGLFEGGTITLKVGETFILDDNPEPGTKDRVCLPHDNIFPILKPGVKLLLNDGRVALRVQDHHGRTVRCIVEVEGELSDRKGLSVPDEVLPVSALTDKDRVDLKSALELGADIIAISFIQRPEDLIEARKIIDGRASVAAKIEKPLALTHIREIIELSDIAMVARGDLGVELPLEKVPGVQKRLIRLLRSEGKPVIVATQMLESMISAPVPTRAEVSDVATAVFDGADAVMLSAESATGDFPVQAVEMMDRVAREVESDPDHIAILRSVDTLPQATGPDALAMAARGVAETLSLPAIVCYTGSGATGTRLSRVRPMAPILALTPELTVARRLSLVWGIHCILTADAKTLVDVVNRACLLALREELAKSGERILITAGVPLGTPGATNMLRIAQIGDVEK